MTADDLRIEFDVASPNRLGWQLTVYAQWLERRCLEQDSTIAELKGEVGKKQAVCEQLMFDERIARGEWDRLKLERDETRVKALEEAAQACERSGDCPEPKGRFSCHDHDARKIRSLRKSQEADHD